MAILTADAPSTDDAQPTRVCLRCGEPKPYALMVKSKNSPGGVAPWCLECQRTERQAERAGIARTPVDFELTSDHRPAVRLRLLLARDRTDGYAFSAVWAEDVRCVLGRIANGSERAAWSAVFSSQRDVWLAAYERTLEPMRLSPTLLVDVGT